MGTGAATRSVAPDLTSLPRWALVLPCVIWLQTLPTCPGGLRRCHMSYGSGPRLPAEEGSGAATCHMALDPASLWGGLQRCHVSCSFLWAAGLKHKERLSWPSYVAKLVCFQGLPCSEIESVSSRLDSGCPPAAPRSNPVLGPIRHDMQEYYDLRQGSSR
jgi:hypothetical protein